MILRFHVVKCIRQSLLYMSLFDGYKILAANLALILLNSIGLKNYILNYILTRSFFLSCSTKTAR